MAESLGERPDEGAGNGDKAAAGAVKSHGNLPMVVAPKLGAGEDEADETAGETADETAAAAAAAPAYSSRFLVLAAAVACAAAFGSFVGSVSGSGLAHVLYQPASGSGAATTADATRELKLELSDLAAIKAKLADRLDRLDQHAGAATETTGSIAAASPQPPAPAPKLTDRILPDWVVQDVQGGRALVENRYGGVFDVGAGSTLPGVGRVDAIKRQDGQWLVLTERGTITSGR